MHNSTEGGPLHNSGDFYALGYRLIVARRDEPIIDSAACADWLATPPPATPAGQSRRGSFADHALEFPEAEG